MYAYKYARAVVSALFVLFSLQTQLFAAPSNAYSENEYVHLHGTVIDSKTKAPLPGAQVFIRELQIGAVTDEMGEYNIRMRTRGRFTVICRFIGYAEIKKDYIFSKQSVEQNFALTPEAVTVGEVVVTADQADVNSLTVSSQSIAVLTDRKLEQIRGQTLGETLAELPGITTLQTGPSISKPVIRGLHSQRLIVANAGVPQEGQQWGAEHAPEIDPFAPARIEVVKGAASVQYGVGAIGGVIRVQPRDLRREGGIGGQLTLNAFSNNLQGAGSLLLEGGFERFRGLGWRVQGSFRRAGDSRAPEYLIRNSGFDERDWSAALGYHQEMTGLEMYFSHFGTELGIFRGSHIGNLSDLQRAIERGEPSVDADFTFHINPPKQEISHNLLSVNAHHHFKNTGVLELQYGWQQNQRQEFDAHQPFTSVPPKNAAFDLTLTTYSADLTFQHDPIKNVFGKIGISGIRQGNVRQSTGFLIPNFRAYTGGLFILENWIHGKWTVNTGVRYDYRWLKVFQFESKNIPETVREYTNLTGVVGVIYQFAKSWSIGTNIGTAWRPPSVNELFSDGVHHGAAQYEKGDPLLRSEKSLNLDATLRHVGARTRGELSLFNNRFDNFIFLFPETDFALTIRGAFPAFSYRQADAVIRGFDGAFEFELTQSLHFDLTASVIRGDNLDADEPLFLMPADRFKIGTHYNLPDWGSLKNSNLEVAGTFVRRQNRFPEAADFTDPPPGYNLFDLNFSSQLMLAARPINVRLSVNNIFNTQYRDYMSRFRYFIDDPGRNIILRVNVPFGQFE